MTFAPLLIVTFSAYNLECLYILLDVMVTFLKLPIGTKGQNEIYVDTYKLPNGIYIYSLVTDGRLIDTKRMIIAN